MSIIQRILDTKAAGHPLSQSVYQSLFGELPILIITHETGSAAISLQGAQLLFWRSANQSTPVIWLSENALFKKGTAIRGGIPVCWPWFGKLGDPGHGFARIVDWKIDSINENSHGVSVVLSLSNNQQTAPYFSKAFDVQLKIDLGHTCQVELSCRGDFDATSALHTYFGIDDIENVIITGLGDHYEERTQVENKPKISGQLNFSQEVDRIYTQAETHIMIKDGKRTIRLTNINAHDVVTWNPWAEKSKTTTDLGENSYKKMVCAETCRINHTLKLSPSDYTTYGFKVELI